MATIRRAEPRDIEEMVGLLGELFSIESDFMPDHEKQRRGLELMLASSPDRHVLAAEDAGRVIGMASVQVLISTAMGMEVGLVEDVVVTRNRRGEGIGQRLLEELEAWASRRGLGRLQLLADITNQPALNFYRRSGWAETQLIGLRKRLM